MNIDTITNLLKCIKCGSPQIIHLKEENTLLCKNCNKKYDITDNVPVFLPEDINADESRTYIHKQLQTTFSYIDHYQKDAIESDYFAERDPGTEHSDRRVRETIGAEISGVKGSILDVGCGNAWVAGLFCPRGYEVTSLDISIINTSKAIKLYPFENHFAIAADSFTLPFRNNSFDYIIASEIIEHVYDPAGFIKSLFSVLKPGGKLLVTTPYKEKIQYSLCIHCNKPTPLHAHLHSFDEKSIKTLYTSDDIKNVKSQTFINKIPVHLRMHKILGHINFNAWKLFDKALNLVYNKPLRILITWEKKV